MRIIVALLGVLLTLIIGIVVGGFTIATLWGWFVVPFGAPAINYAHAAGLVLLVNAMLGSRGTSAENKDFEQASDGEKIALVTIKPIATYGLVLLCGWIVHSLM